MKACVKDIEMVYGIHFGERVDGYYGPCEKEEAECIIGENESDEFLIAQMINAEFLNQWAEYMVIDNGPSIHIHHKINGKQGGIALVLMYKQDLEPTPLFSGWTTIEA